MVINYPKAKVSIQNGVLRIEALSDISEVKACSFTIPDGVRVNNTSYGIDIYGQERENVQGFCKQVQDSILSMNTNENA